MDPMTLSALITTGSGLLGALMTPSPKKKMQWERENAQKMATWQAGQVTSTLKPKTPYYQSGNLPQLGAASMQAVMGNLMQRFGPEMLAKWGINPAVQPPTAAAPAPPAGQAFIPPPAAPAGPMARQPQGFPGQEILLKRYQGGM